MKAMDVEVKLWRTGESYWQPGFRRTIHAISIDDAILWAIKQCSFDPDHYEGSQMVVLDGVPSMQTRKGGPVKDGAAQFLP